MNNVCVVFDVNDTLYLERDYVRSGFCAVGVWASRWLGVKDFGERCLAAFEAGKRGNIFNSVLTGAGVATTPELIPTLVSIYRTHMPDIKLAGDAVEVLDRLARPLAIITDGPAISQSRKIEALGLNRFFSPILLTEIFGREFCKPHHRAFLEVQRIVPAHRFIYVADNPVKDFIAPRELGWRTIRIRRPHGLHAAIDGGGADFELPDCRGLEALIG